MSNLVVSSNSFLSSNFLRVIKLFTFICPTLRCAFPNCSYFFASLVHWNSLSCLCFVWLKGLFVNCCCCCTSEHGTSCWMFPIKHGGHFHWKSCADILGHLHYHIYCRYGTIYSMNHTALPCVCWPLAICIQNMDS